MTKTNTYTMAAIAKQLGVQVAQTTVLAQMYATFGATVTRPQTKSWEKTQGVSLRFFRANKANRLGRGVYQIPASVTGVAVAVPVVDDAVTVVADARATVDDQARLAFMAAQLGVPLTEEQVDAANAANAAA